MTDTLGRAARAKAILDSAEWQEAWTSYRDRIIAEMEKAQSNDVETVMHLKRLLNSAKAAQSHLESLISEGKVKAAELEMERKRSLMSKLRAV